MAATGTTPTFTAGDFQHVIFNLRLQEGWDDPLCYFAYIDKSMESRVQVEQVIGRVLRQPSASTIRPSRLNTAHFYVRVDKQRRLQRVVAEVEKELGSEPGGIRIAVSSPGTPQMDAVPPAVEVDRARDWDQTAGSPCSAIQELMDAFPDFREDTINTTR